MFTLKVEEGLELVMFEFNQAEELFLLIEKNREYLKRWLGWVDRSRSISDSVDFIKFTKQSYVNDQGIKVGIWHKNKLIGLIDHHGANKNNKSVNIGYWLDEDYQGQGIMTKVTETMIEYAFDLGMNKVEIRCASKNEKSKAIPIKLRLKQEGVIRAAEYLNGYFVDHIVYGVLRNEWYADDK